MAANTIPIFPKTANNGVQTFANADGTGLKDLVTGGADGTLVGAVNVVSDDTAARNIDIYYKPSGGAAIRIGTALIAIGAGVTSDTSSVNALTKCVGAVGGRIFLANGDKLQGAMQVAVTAAKTVSVVAMAANY